MALNKENRLISSAQSECYNTPKGNLFINWWLSQSFWREYSLWDFTIPAYIQCYYCFPVQQNLVSREVTYSLCKITFLCDEMMDCIYRIHFSDYLIYYEVSFFSICCRRCWCWKQQAVPHWRVWSSACQSYSSNSQQQATPTLLHSQGPVTSSGSTPPPLPQGWCQSQL